MASTETTSHGNEASAADLNQTTTMTACEKVFGTVELLDMILMNNLRPYRWGETSTYEQKRQHQLFMLQKVNKLFFNHIHGATGITRSLHLAPVLTLHGVARSLHLAPTQALHTRIYVVDQYAELHKILPRRDIIYLKSCLTILRISRKTLNLPLSQSWSKLLLWQPPIVALQMTPSSSAELPPRSRSKAPRKDEVVHCVTGLTIGAVLEAGRKFLDNSPERGCCDEVMFSAHIDGEGKERVLEYLDLDVVFDHFAGIAHPPLKGYRYSRGGRLLLRPPGTPYEIIQRRTVK